MGKQDNTWDLQEEYRETGDPIWLVGDVIMWTVTPLFPSLRNMAREDRERREFAHKDDPYGTYTSDDELPRASYPE